jgi:hypothetical protein
MLRVRAVLYFTSAHFLHKARIGCVGCLGHPTRTEGSLKPDTEDMLTTDCTIVLFGSLMLMLYSMAQTQDDESFDSTVTSDQLGDEE